VEQPLKLPFDAATRRTQVEMCNQTSTAYVAQINGRYVRRCLITYGQLSEMRRLFQRRARMRRLEVTTAEVDDALWVLLETGVLLPPFDNEAGKAVSHGSWCASPQHRMMQ
jgi:hypothetical protein